MLIYSIWLWILKPSAPFKNSFPPPWWRRPGSWRTTTPYVSLSPRLRVQLDYSDVSDVSGIIRFCQIYHGGTNPSPRLGPPDHVTPCLCVTALLFLLVAGTFFFLNPPAPLLFWGKKHRHLLTVAKDIHPFRVKNMDHGVRANCRGWSWLMAEPSCRFFLLRSDTHSPCILTSSCAFY